MSLGGQENISGFSHRDGLERMANAPLERIHPCMSVAIIEKFYGRPTFGTL